MTVSSPTARKLLAEARNALVKERDALNRDIEDLDRMLQGYSAPGSGKSSHVVRPDVIRDDFVVEYKSSPPLPPMRDEILAVLEQYNRDVATAEIVKVLTSKYDWQPSSIRSLIGKLARDGEVENVRRGVYRAASEAVHADSENSSGPAESAGPEASVTTTDTGGDAHVHPDQDHGDDQARRHRVDRGGAPVMAGSTE